MANDTVPPAPAIEDESSVLVLPEAAELVRAGLLGVGVGLLIPLLGYLLQKFIITPLLCQQTSAVAVCAPSDLTAFYVSTVIVSVMGIALMANWQIFRPLLIAAAAASALWGFRKFAGHTESQAGFEFYSTSALLYSVAYMLFYWLLRLRNFALSVALTVIAVVLIRWALLA